MERLKRSFSFKKKKDHVPESHKPHQWQEDERKVREGTCSFQVRYLGCIEVFESRGIQVCEEAVKALKSKNKRSVWSRMSMRRKKKDKENQQESDIEQVDDPQCKGKYQRAILYVSGDALRVVDEISKGLIVDQTIEKVSFCAPDRNHEKGFAYICRDGTTRRWMCHGFYAVKETGERLSHAVGCAFAICLERKQKREKDSVTVTFNDKGTSFTRTGSFRQTTLTERLADPQSAIIAEPVPGVAPENIHAVQRPHATVDMLQRQSSFRGFQKLNESSPFKRQLSLRMNELPSTLDRQKQFGHSNLANGGFAVPSIPEASPSKEHPEESISDMCQQLTQGLTALTTTDDPFASAPNSAALMAAQQQNNLGASNIPGAAKQPVVSSSNPWGTPPFSAPSNGVSDADFWLSVATSIAKDTSTTVTTTTNSMGPVMQTNSMAMNGAVQLTPSPINPNPLAIQQSSPWSHNQQGAVGVQHNTAFQAVTERAPHLAQVRSHSVDTAEMWQAQHRNPTLRELSQRGPVNQFASQTQPPVLNWSSAGGGTRTTTSAFPVQQATTKVDPFEAAWVAKSSNKATNPFQAGDATVTKSFEVNL